MELDTKDIVLELAEPLITLNWEWAMIYYNVLVAGSRKLSKSTLEIHVLTISSLLLISYFVYLLYNQVWTKLQEDLIVIGDRKIVTLYIHYTVKQTLNYRKNILLLVIRKLLLCILFIQSQKYYGIRDMGRICEI